MLGGGKWTTQNKKLSGAYINFVSKNTGKGTFNIPNEPISNYYLLTDGNKHYLKTADGQYLAVLNV